MKRIRVSKEAYDALALSANCPLIDWVEPNEDGSYSIEVDIEVYETLLARSDKYTHGDINTLIIMMAKEYIGN